MKILQWLVRIQKFCLDLDDTLLYADWTCNWIYIVQYKYMGLDQICQLQLLCTAIMKKMHEGWFEKTGNNI